MDKRKLNIIVNKAGGTAGKGSFNYKMSIPSAWAKEMGVTKEDRKVVVEFDGEKITIKKEMNKMKNLKSENLMMVHTNEDETNDLEFQFEDKKVFVRNAVVYSDAAPDSIDYEEYWDKAKNVERAVAEASAEDIEEQ